MIKKDILPNGMVVLTENIAHTNSCAMGLWVKAGSRHENYDDRGISHFLEHMNFKGTVKRNSKEISEALEMVGGNINAFTSKEYTSYYGQVLGDDNELCVDVLSDLFLNSTYDPAEIEKEKGVVIEEIKLYEDTPDELVIDLINKVIWKDHPLGVPILGDEDSVNSFTQDRAKAYRKKMYCPKNTVFAAAGNVNHEEMMALIDKYFHGFGDESGDLVADNIPVPIFHSGKIKVIKDIEQEHMMIGIPGLSYYHKDYYTWVMINEALGGGSSSRLFQKIREEMGLSYSVFSFISSYQDCGMISIYAGCAKGNSDIIIEECCKEINLIKEDGLLPNEIQMIKNQIKGSMLIGMDSISSRLSRLGRNALCYGRVIDQEEVVGKIMSIDNDMIIKVANDLFDKANFSYSVVGGK